MTDIDDIRNALDRFQRNEEEWAAISCELDRVRKPLYQAGTPGPNRDETDLEVVKRLVALAEQGGRMAWICNTTGKMIKAGSVVMVDPAVPGLFDFPAPAVQKRSVFCYTSGCIKHPGHRGDHQIKVRVTGDLAGRYVTNSQPAPPPPPWAAYSDGYMGRTATWNVPNTWEKK